MAKGKRTNPIVLRRGMAIGTGNAETDDDFLFDCFVHYPPVDECVRTQSPGMILAGRTGSGKTAILRYVERTASSSSMLDPTEMSMNYVANSDALRFLSAIGADLDLLFQVLWKHVLCIEFIRLRWRVDSEAKSKNVFERLVSRFSKDARKSKAISYLTAWEGKFWITMDQNIKELTEGFEEKLQAEIGTDINKFKMGGQYDKRLSVEKKSEIVARTRNIINADQLRELHGIIDILADNANDDEMLGCYLMIDGLDDRWVDEKMRFRLIRALISSLRQFRAISSLKILVSLRTDILERVVQETNDITFQREKFEDYFIRITWTRSELKLLVNNRIRTLFRRQYTSEDVLFEDIFTYKIKNKDPFDYIIERTHMRPRDVISFVNECFVAADGQSEIAPTHMAKAEVEYARKRRDALVQEWRSAFPTLSGLLTFATSTRQVAVDFAELIDGSALDELALDICAQGKISFDPMFEFAQAVLDEKSSSRVVFLRNIVSTLYRVGAVGVKLRPDERFIYADTDDPLISPELLALDIRMRIHPMLHAAYRLNDQDGRRGGRAKHLN